MVADFEEGRILGELNDLEDEIFSLQATIGILEGLERPNFRDVYKKYIKNLNRTLTRLQDTKYHQEMRLKIHRQKVKESGVKY